METKANPHYANHKIQPIDIIQEYNLGFVLGNAVKYVVRSGEKNRDEDIRKAIWYLLFELGYDKLEIDKFVKRLAAGEDLV